MASPTSPPMGWNSFDSYGLFLDESTATAGLEWFAEHLAPHGYEYFVIDAGWYNEHELVPGTMTPTSDTPTSRRLDSYGRYLPSATYFPHGIAAIAGRAHELGVKFGLHIMRGVPRAAVHAGLPVLGTSYTAADIADQDDRCRWNDANYGIDMTRPGAQAYYDAWIALIASWGVDFIKADDITAFPAEVEAVATAIERSGRPMLLSLSPGGDTDHRFLPAYRAADMLRVTRDIWDSRSDLERAFDGWYAWQHSADDLWLDLDMLCLGRLRVRTALDASDVDDDVVAARVGRGRDRACRLTAGQQRTFVTMRALASSPLFFGGDPLQCDPTTLGLITDPDVVRCNQDGAVGRFRYAADGIEVWVSPHRDDDNSGWFGVFNRTQRPVRAQVPPGVIHGGDHTLRVHDVWQEQPLADLPASGWLDREIEADDVLFASYQTEQ